MNRPHLVDRTRVEIDWTCERRRYWHSEYGRDQGLVGITPVGEALELVFGSALHSALSSLALGTLPPETIAEALRAEILHGYRNQSPDKQNEAVALAEGLWWAFLRTVWPSILEDYRILAVERELTLDVDPAGSIRLMVKPDLIVQRKSDLTVWYLEYKTTGFKTQNWLEGWRYAIQLHAGCLAAEKELGIPVEGAQVIGFYKGYEKDGKLRSPFTYAYFLQGVPGVVPDRWTHDYIRGWDLVSLAHYPEGMRAWVDALPLETLQEQFPITGAIPIRRDVVQGFLEQLERRERDIIGFHGGWLSLEATFPQRFKSCRPLIGRPCPYIECCFSPSVAGDPIGSELYQPREPHHTLEIIELEAQ